MDGGRIIACTAYKSGLSYILVSFVLNERSSHSMNSSLYTTAYQLLVLYFILL
jgi:hypothetical protein